MSILSVALVLLAGFGLYVSRSWLLPPLDTFVPSLELPAGAASDTSEAPEEVGNTAAKPLDMVNLECLPAEIESALLPLLEDTENLIAAGRIEIREFRGMSGDGGGALALRNRWSSWAVIWFNRLNPIRSALPPLSVCAGAEEMFPTCDAVRSSMYWLERVPEAESAAEANQMLDRAQEILDGFRQFQKEEADLALLAAEVAAQAEALQAAQPQPTNEPP
jgi:hypothetical protein